MTTMDSLIHDEDLRSLIPRWHFGWTVDSAADRELDLTDLPVRNYDLGDLRIVNCDTGGACTGRRTRQAIDTNDDSYIAFLMLVHGVEFVSFGEDRSYRIRDGQALLWDTRVNGRYEVPDGIQKSTVFVPRSLVEAWTPHIDEVISRGPLLPASTIALRSLAAALDAMPNSIVESQAGAVSSAVRELLYVSLGIGDSAGSAGSATERRWRSAIDFIEDRLPSGTTAEQLAAHLSLSTRAIYQLFADHGATVRTYSRRRRLARARAELLHPHEEPIAVIADRWGFLDQSSFTKMYRAEFGETPGYTRRNRARPTLIS